MADVAIPGGDDGDGNKAAEVAAVGSQAPNSDYRRRHLPVVPVPTGLVPWSLPQGTPAGASKSTATYVTPDPVLPAPVDPHVDGPAAPGVHGCLWPSELQVAGSGDMNTPAGEHVYTHSADINEEMVPKKGMRFKDVEHAYLFYSDYAEVVGFGIKKYREKNGCKWMNCVREGKCKPKLTQGKRSRKKTSKRVGCKAGIKLRKVFDENGTLQWVVVDLVNHCHNHSLMPSPTTTKHFHCNKAKDPTYLEYIASLQASRVPTHLVMDHMADLHGGPEHVPLTRRHVENMKATQSVEDKMDDVPKLLAFFTECKQENPQFYCDFQLDNTGKIVSIFWSSASMQGEYADFGDVMTFDTTHKTNLYQKPLAMFVGANHHLQCTVFGIALLGNETTETFAWVFSTFKKCMGGHSPQCILTDQDPAMPAAIHLVFPGTIHRLCLWHVINKFQPMLNELYSRFIKKLFKEKFNSAVHHPLTPREFEDAWAMLLNEFELHEDPTLQILYDMRKDWVPCYFKKDYCGLMTSTQRSESVNNIVKSCHVDANTPLHKFAKQMLKFIHRRKMDEAQETYSCTSETLADSLWPFEVRVGAVYTRAVFGRFEESMKLATAFRITQDIAKGDKSWLVQHTKTSKKIVWGQHQFEVTVDEEKELFACECKQLEHTGLFCVHLLRTFMHVQLDKIPSKFILQRYCRNARKELPFDRVDRRMKGADGETKASRHKKMMTKVMTLVRFAIMSKPAMERSLDGLDDLIALVKELQPDIGVGDIDLDDEEEVGNTQATQDREQQPDPPMLGNTSGTSRQVELNSDQPASNCMTANLQLNVMAIGGQLTNAAELQSSMVVGFGLDISLEQPDKAKPKGRTIDASEHKTLKLGAKDEKKGTRRCKTCGIKDGHNSSTCLQLEANRQRLASLANKKKGRPPGSKNQNHATADGGVEKEVPKRRRVVVFDDEDGDEDGDETVAVPLDNSPSPEDATPAPRKRGRPPGSKNKRTISKST